MQICRLTLMRKALTLRVCAPLNFNVRRGWLPVRVEERWTKTLLWKSNENLKFKQMSKCTTESNVDESRDTFHFEAWNAGNRHQSGCQLPLFASRCLLLNQKTQQLYNCGTYFIHSMKKKKKTAKANWLTTLKHSDFISKATPFLTFSCYYG